MNVTDIRNALTQKMGLTGLKIQKYSPEILLGVGLVGMAATVVMASKATLKVNDLSIEIEEERAEIELAEEAGKTSSGKPYSNEDYTKDLVVHHVQSGLKYAKLYAPTAAVGALSIWAILASHGIMARRQVALVAAYNLLSEGWAAYRQRVIEHVGEEKENLIYTGVEEVEIVETEVDDEGKKKKVKKVRYGAPKLSRYARLYDNSSTQFHDSPILNKAFLLGMQRHMNDLLLIDGFVFLNQVYRDLGLPLCPEGQLVGWVLKSPEQMRAEGRDGYISFGLDNVINQDFMNGHNDTVWLDFNVDGLVYNLI